MTLWISNEICQTYTLTQAINGMRGLSGPANGVIGVEYDAWVQPLGLTQHSSIPGCCMENYTKYDF